ncbi:hypothetical protein [Verminephrobacter aporrectodeae]|uniref:hypothetical protein n=1 Tax=Verminephrobacter aporrectodeae TaxID=1110389 RepID=UPI002237BA65|nr:hypothetical protein [Verminephrobacter aporrectodeae]
MKMLNEALRRAAALAAPPLNAEPAAARANGRTEQKSEEETQRIPADMMNEALAELSGWKTDDENAE